MYASVLKEFDQQLQASPFKVYCEHHVATSNLLFLLILVVAVVILPVTVYSGQ